MIKKNTEFWQYTFCLDQPDPEQRPPAQPGTHPQQSPAQPEKEIHAFENSSERTRRRQKQNLIEIMKQA